MKETKRQRRRERSGRAGPEPRVVRIDCNPGPDPQDRLRRLFTLLVRLAAREDRTEAAD